MSSAYPMVPKVRARILLRGFENPEPSALLDREIFIDLSDGKLKYFLDGEIKTVALEGGTKVMGKVEFELKGGGKRKVEPGKPHYLAVKGKEPSRVSVGDVVISVAPGEEIWISSFLPFSEISCEYGKVFVSVVPMRV